MRISRRRRGRLGTALLTAAALVLTAPLNAAATGGVVRDDDNELDRTVDLDYTDDLATKRLVLPAGILTGATSATLSVYGKADGCGGPTGNAQRLLVNNAAAVNFDPCLKWSTSDYSWATFTFPMTMLRQGTTNTFRILEIAGTWEDRNVFLGVDTDRDFARSDVHQASSAFTGDIPGELMWYLTVLPLPSENVLAEEGFEPGSGATYHGIGATRDCTRFDTGACSLRLAPTGHGNYIRGERILNTQFQGRTTVSFAFQGHDLNGDVDSWATVKLNKGSVTLGLTEFWSPNNRVSLYSEGKGEVVSFTSWPTANIWYEARLVFDPAADTVTATVNGVTRSLPIQWDATLVEKVEFGAVRWSSFGFPMQYDTLRVTTEKPPNALPTTELVSPMDGFTYVGAIDQIFHVRGHDDDGDDYRGHVVVRNASGAIVREMDTQTVASDQVAYVKADPPFTTGTYTWTAYAIDEHDGAGGAATPPRTFVVQNCPNDADCDNVPDADEQRLGMNRLRQDSDFDGLRDDWEVPKGTPGRGIRVDGEVIDPDLVFGPYGSGAGCKEQLDDEARYTKQFACLNRPPNPLHKDVYVEIDWQDCSRGGCPEIPLPGFDDFFPNFPLPIPDPEPIKIDTLHHAPNAAGLRDVVAMYAKADVTNRDRKIGVNLNVLVDQGVEHTPNCLTPNGTRAEFGTETQQAKARIMKARAKAVRYVLSGHSAAESEDCSTPWWTEVATDRPLPDYDWSSFGAVNTGGDFIALTLGPLWNCPSFAAKGLSPDWADGDLSLCFKEMAGIFPAKIEGHGGTFEYPIHMMLGEKEAEAGRQLYARSLAHLLGHALGLESDDHVHNTPAPAGRRQVDRKQLTALPPADYATWTGLKFAPDGPGVARADEPEPNYSELENDDPDADTVPTWDDNCPTVWNKDQRNSDRRTIGLPGIAEIDLGPADYQGDACDPDIDGDGLMDAPGANDGQVVNASPLRSVLMAGSAEASEPEPATSPAVAYDPYPFDTDNDGVDNDDDADDDGDGAADSADTCPLTPNAGDGDADGDGAGNACDGDADGDGMNLVLESLTRSDPLDGSSTPEYVGLGATCANGTDDDGDGAADAADTGCADGDRDGWADVYDTCATVPDPSNADNDGDGRGNSCDASVFLEGVSKSPLGPDDDTVTVAFSGHRAGTYDVRIGGDGCTSGTPVAGGSYTPGEQAQLVDVPASSLPEGATTIRICLTADGETHSVTAEVVRDLSAPAAAVALDAASDSGSSAGDAVTNVDVPVLTGVTDPGAVVVLHEDGIHADLVTADDEGRWSAKPPSAPSEGTHTYRVHVVDVAGNEATSGDLTVTFDRTAPVSTIGDLPAETPDPVAVTFTANEPAGFECSLDGGAWVACTSPHTLSPPPGVHTVGVRATDVAGNAEAAAVTRSWRTVYRFSGFLAPVDNAPTVNRVNAGAAVPVKFSLGGDWGLDVFEDGSPSSGAVACDTNEVVDDVEETVAASRSGLQYDAASGTYVYVWKTDQAWAGTCRVLRLRLDDGSTRSAYFRFR